MKQPTIQVYTVEKEETGKRRIGICLIKDEWMQIDLFVDADTAEKLATTLLECAQEARGKNVIIPGGYKH